jgi:phage terminase large subunit GpA-like protein
LGQPEVLLHSLSRFFQFLPGEQTRVAAATDRREGTVIRLLQKQVPVSLATPEYDDLRKRVFRRDAWRCQFCGFMTNLEVHHQTFRSHSGQDREENLITLCTDCHSSAHRRKG